MKKSVVLICFVSFVIANVTSAQNTPVRIAFWNMENFFDPFVDSTKTYNAFTEDGMQHWTKSRFYRKRNNMYKAILSLETLDECIKFFDDLCSVSELMAMEQRYQVASCLNKGMIYNDILAETGASSATISRVNRSLQYGSGGYAIVFDRVREDEA